MGGLWSAAAGGGTRYDTCGRPRDESPMTAIRGRVRIGLLGCVIAGVSLVATGLVILPTAALGTWRNRSKGNTDIALAATVGISGVITAFLASRVSVARFFRFSPDPASDLPSKSSVHPAADSAALSVLAAPIARAVPPMTSAIVRWSIRQGVSGGLL